MLLLWLLLLAASVSLSGAAPTPISIGVDGPYNAVEGAAVEVTVIDDGDVISCSGVMVASTGAVLTAVHCFQEPSMCDFDTAIPGFPLALGPYLVDVMGINGTAGSGERLTYTASVVAWSGMADVMVLQIDQPIAGQPYLRFANSAHAVRGSDVRMLSFDLGWVKKLGHKGSILAVNRDFGSDFWSSSEQVIIDGNGESGSSGSAAFDGNLGIVMAPLTYGYTSDSGNLYANSGTSSRVSGALTRRILAGARRRGAPPDNQLLAPSLGIIPFDVMSGLERALNFDPAFLLTLPNKGIFFVWLAVQGFYDFLTEEVGGCCFAPHTVIPPSLLDAPLSETFSGTPPDPFPDFPAPDGAIVLLLAMETAGPGIWFELGEDAGLETVSGLLANHWVGDVIRVRIRCISSTAPEDPTANWDAAYSVTLQATDPFWDTITMGPFASYAPHIRVNTTSHTLHLDKTLHRVPKTMRLKKPRSALSLRKMKQVAAHAPAPPQAAATGQQRRCKRDSDVYAPVNLQSLAPPAPGFATLPTLADLYAQKHKQNQQQREKTKTKK